MYVASLTVSPPTLPPPTSSSSAVLSKSQLLIVKVTDPHETVLASGKGVYVLDVSHLPLLLLIIMATLVPGILPKLIDAMNAGTKLFKEGRAALLQVTEILPVGLDDKDLWPKHGFYIKVSDSSYAIYASLPMDQDDLILSNKLQLGQFIQVDWLQSGDPVPVLQGTKLVPGRHPVVGSPELITEIGEEGGSSCRQYGSISRRSSWSSEQFSLTAFSPKRSDSSKPPTSTRKGRKSTPANENETVLSRMMGSIGEVSAMSKIKNLVTSTLSPKNRSLEDEPNRMESSSSPPLSTEGQEPSSTPSIYQLGNASPMKCSSLAGVPLPEKLDNLGKEAMQQRVAAQRIALQALRDVSSIETIVRILKTFSCLTTSSNSGSPTSCFEQFLSFHEEITQAITSMEANIKKNKEQKPCKQVGNKKDSIRNINEENSKLIKNSELETSIELARNIKIEGGNWFMEFLEAVVLEMDFRIPSKRSNCGCTQELLLNIINWVKVERCIDVSDDQNTRAAHIIKVLRRNVKNS